MIKHNFKLVREIRPEVSIFYRWRCTICDYWLGLDKAYFRAILTVPELSGQIPWKIPLIERLMDPCRLPYDGGNQP